MRKEVLGMSASERERAWVVRRHVEEGLSQREALERLGIGVRQFKRLVRACQDGGNAALVSRQRERPSNKRLAADRRAQIEGLLRGKYEGFGPTLAAEKLAAVEGITMSVEDAAADADRPRPVAAQEAPGEAGVPVELLLTLRREA